MIVFLKLIKKKIPIIWVIIEKINGTILKIFWHEDLQRAKKAICAFSTRSNCKFINCSLENIDLLLNLFNSFSHDDIKYFKPFEFSYVSFNRILSSYTYQIFLAMNGGKPCGMFFLRYFVNKQCFLGLIVDKRYQGKGIGKDMIRAMAEGAKNSKFVLMSTICNKNISSLKTHLSAAPFKIVKTLSSDEVVLKLEQLI